MLASHCHPADGIFDTNILLSHAICPSFCRYGLVTKKIARDRARVSITSSLVQCHTPGLAAVTKFKTTKINSEGLLGLSTKISTPKITRHTVPRVLQCRCERARAPCYATTSLLTTFTYILCQVVYMSRQHMMGSVDRRGQQNAVFATLMGIAKQFEA